MVPAKSLLECFSASSVPSGVWRFNVPVLYSYLTLRYAFVSSPGKDPLDSQLLPLLLRPAHELPKSLP